MFVGLRKPEELIVIVMTLLAYRCPVQAIVHALKLDERTVARWQERAGAHCRDLSTRIRLCKGSWIFNMDKRMRFEGKDGK